MTERDDPERTYLARRRRRRFLVLGGIAVALLAVVVTARRPDLGDPCDAPDAAPADETALLPTGLTFDGIGTITSVQEEDPYVQIKAVTTKPLDEVTVQIQDAVTAAGYRPAGMDNEGFEAEVFFTKGTLAGGQARVEQSACSGRWDVDLVLLR
jgi:hypothetical protein